eukprot:scaffold1911_cov181-Isochrysis_galbana.AAC.2
MPICPASHKEAWARYIHLTEHKVFAPVCVRALPLGLAPFGAFALGSCNHHYSDYHGRHRFAIRATWRHFRHFITVPEGGVARARDMRGAGLSTTRGPPVC